MIRRLAVWALAGWSLPAAALTVEQAVTAHLRQGAGPAAGGRAPVRRGVSRR